MFVSRWKGPAWRKPAVTRRQYSPSAIVACETPPSSVSELLSAPAPPPSSEPMPTTTLIPIRM